MTAFRAPLSLDRHAHCIAQGDVIVPLAMETGGRICEGGASLLGAATNPTGGTKGKKLAFLTYYTRSQSRSYTRSHCVHGRLLTPICPHVCGRLV